MHDPNTSTSNTEHPSPRDERDEQEREWQTDDEDRAALLEAWKAFYAQHPDARQVWSHELIEEERGDR